MVGAWQQVRDQPFDKVPVQTLLVQRQASERDWLISHCVLMPGQSRAKVSGANNQRAGVEATL